MYFSTCLFTDGREAKNTITSNLRVFQGALNHRVIAHGVRAVRKHLFHAVAAYDRAQAVGHKLDAAALIAERGLVTPAGHASPVLR